MRGADGVFGTRAAKRSQNHAYERATFQADGTADIAARARGDAKCTLSLNPQSGSTLPIVIVYTLPVPLIVPDINCLINVRQ